jgi:hypothetical protein
MLRRRDSGSSWRRRTRRLGMRRHAEGEANRRLTGRGGCLKRGRRLKRLLSRSKEKRWLLVKNRLLQGKLLKSTANSKAFMMKARCSSHQKWE